MAELFDSLKNYSKKRISSFHTPGHSGNADFLKKALDLRLDLTELPETASLYDGGGIIEDSEKRMAEIFSAKKTLYSAGGCTLAIQTMLKLCAFPGGKVIAGRNVHKSAVNAMALLGLEPVWLYPDNSAGEFFNGRISETAVEKALKENTDVCAVYITTPDYFGVISPIDKISKVTKKYSVPLIVDNAHGSHLIFFNMHPLTRGADMSACSLHKTLPVLTGGAALNIANENYCENAKQAMAVFGSTSPSFLTLASIDLCADYLKTNGKEDFIKLADTVKELKNIAEKRGFPMPIGECDPVRLVLNTAALGVDGETAYSYFRNRMIEPEMQDGRRTVFILTPFNTAEDIERLKNAIINFPDGNMIFEKETVHVPEKSLMTMREAFTAENVRVKTAEAVGRVAAQSVCSCPPGVPPIVAGETVDAATAEILQRYGFDYLNIVK